VEGGQWRWAPRAWRWAWAWEQVVVVVVVGGGVGGLAVAVWLMSMRKDWKEREWCRRPRLPARLCFPLESRRKVSSSGEVPIRITVFARVAYVRPTGRVNGNGKGTGQQEQERSPRTRQQQRQKTTTTTMATTTTSRARQHGPRRNERLRETGRV